MNSTIKKQTDAQAIFTVKMDEAAMAPIVANTYERLRQGVKVAGFRPGKAPNSIIDRELGSSAVQAEVLDAITAHSYAHAIREHELSPITSPDVKLSKFVPYTELEYEATVELLPPIKLGDYKHLKTKPAEIKIEPAEIDQVIEDLRPRVAQRHDLDRAAQTGDEVVFDFDGTRDGQSVPGAKSQNYPLLLGSGAFIPGFEEELVGLKAGDAKDFDITFPNDYGQADLAGQKVRFAVKVHRVVEVVLPEVNDQFASLVGPHARLEDLRTAIADSIKTQKQETAGKEYEQAMLEELQRGTKLSVPQKLIDAQMEKLQHDLAENLKQRGQTLEDYAKSRGQSLTDIEKEAAEEAKRRIELALILTEIAKAESISVSDAEIDDEIARLRSQYTDPEMQKELNAPETREEIYNHLMASRTLAKIKSYNEK